jgi:hypothetical protein
MAHFFKVCDICYAHVDEGHLDEHRQWHKTLTNMPARTDTWGKK